MYVEGNGGSNGDVYVLSYDGSHCSNLGLTVSVVDFMFHMYGRYIGTLSMVDAEGRERGSLTGAQGSA